MRSTSLIALTVLLGVVFVAQVSEACFASGVCGVGCAPPPPPTCGGCGGGYACGQYGCYRARARSAKTVHVSSDEQEDEYHHDEEYVADDREPQTPDEKFMACCRDRNLPDACLSKCSFRSYTRDALQAMYFRQDKCPMAAASELQFCAAQGRNHRECCARNGVASTLAGPKCLTFCDQRPGNITKLDLTYMACFDRFENMKGCFWHDLTKGHGRGHARRFDNI
ncbi:hypothetical protein QR680_011466 [Steinernema hermaphroditum]|uniref:Domain of unknown function DB domain-containing protein n=1 Tax=Steinernema hermaphroditum TaxID=289476 RepID=A0AA39HYN4_9BILA|nr:hypothetical protein QR680_011466 [Steinernema hermaphroditum]